MMQTIKRQGLIYLRGPSRESSSSNGLNPLLAAPVAAGLEVPPVPVGVTVADITLGELVERGQSNGGVYRAERGAAEDVFTFANSMRDLAGGEIGDG